MVLTGRLMNHKIVTNFLGKIYDDLDQPVHKNVNAVKQTVGPDRNKWMQQLAALSWFLASFFCNW